MQLPLRLQLKASRSYFLFLASGHILAGVAVCLLPLPPLIRVCVLLLLVLLFLRLWRSTATYLPSLLLRADGKFEVGVSENEAVLASVGKGTVVWPYVVILHGQGESVSFKSLLLFPDSLVGSDDHRHLRVWLRWRAKSGPSD